MANEQIFTHRAESYAKGRFGYAQSVVELIYYEILKPSAKIANIGSGTGIFAREFIDDGFDVFCVEQNEDMRLQAEKLIGGNPHYMPVAASAEETTLPENSVDLITAASAFH